MRATNLTLLTDLYELTMMQGYFKNPTNQTVIFDMFYRVNPCGGSFAITAGLEQMIEYIENLHFTDDDIEYLRSLHIFEDDFLEYLRSFKFTGDIYAIPEGTVVFPREPLVKVIRSDHGGTACRNRNPEYHQSSESDCYQSSQSLLCSPWGRNHGIRPASCTGSGCRYLWCTCSCHRWMRRNFQRN